jgi:hypothetical protein
MSESELAKREQELRFKEQELELAQKNLDTMRQIAYSEHLSQTQTIEKVSKRVAEKLTNDGHICVNGERITRMEGKIDLVLERQADIKEDMNRKHEDTKKDIVTLFEGKNSNSTRINTLETEKRTGIAMLCAIGAGIMSFLTLVVAIWAIIESRREIKEIRNTQAISQPSHIVQYNGIEAQGKP